MRAEIRLLGPVEVMGPRGPAGLQGSRQRAVVAALALHPDQVVSRERLVDVLWDDDPPRTAVKSLHSHVARVRQVLSECGLPGVLPPVERAQRAESARRAYFSALALRSARARSRQARGATE